MSKQVNWSKTILEEFIKEAMLTEEEIKIMTTRIKGWSRTKQALEFNMSVSTLDKLINKLKKKYDIAQQHNSKLPKRRTSPQEEWMDNN